ncbi:WYL domain-containing protein, partial [Nitrospinota bacterium]
RILKAREEGKPEASAEDDKDWHEFTTVALKPHPGLNDDQQQVVADDYGMRKNLLKVEIRLALLYYFLKRLNLDFFEEKRPAREQHIVLANRDEVRKALDRAQYVGPANYEAAARKVN